jgi:hypothetical protein
VRGAVAGHGGPSGDISGIVDVVCGAEVTAEGAQVGVDPVADRERFTISAGGVVVIPKGATVAA